MMDDDLLLSLRDACAATALSETVFLTLVEHGIVQPQGLTPADWCFDLHTVSVARRAVRLHHDLELDWTAVALVVELLEERDRLRADNAALLRRLQRFLDR